MDRFDNRFKIDFSQYRTVKFDYSTIPGVKIDSNNLAFNIATRFNVQLDTKEVIVNQLVAVGYELIKESSPISTIQVEAIFRCPELQSFVVNTEDGVRLTDIFKQVLAGLVASTTRGFLIAKLAGSELDSLVLPVMDPDKLLTPIEPEIISQTK